MKKNLIKNWFNKPSRVDFFLIMLLGLHVFMGFKKGLLYIGGDTGVPMNPIKNLSLLYLWQNLEAGTVWWTLTSVFQLFFFAIFEFLGLSLVATQRLYIYLAHALAGLSMHYLVSSFDLRRKRAVSLIASVFYMFSPWIINYLGIFVFLPYSVMPLILGLFVRGLLGKMDTIKSAVFIALSFFGVIINFPQYSMYFVTTLLMALYWLFYLIVERGGFWRSIKYVFVLALVLLLSSIWFILPYLSSFSLEGVNSEIELAAKISTSAVHFGDFGYATILHLLRMFGAAGFMVGSATYSQPYLGNPLLIVISYLVPILVFSAILLRPKSKSVLYFTIAAIIFIFIAKGVNAPFGKLHFWLVTHFPLARAFRTTWNLSLGANIAFAFLFGVAVVELSSRVGRVSRKYTSGPIAMAVALVFIIGWPLLTGDYFKFKWNPPTFEGVQVPRAYWELEDFLAKDKADFRFFRIPASNGMISTDWGYFGSDFSFSMYTTPSVSGHPLARASRELSEGVYNSIKNRRRLDEDALRTLSLLGIKNIIIDGYDRALTLRPEEIAALETGFSTRDKIGKLNILRLDEKYLLPHIYAAEKIIYTNASPSDFVNVVGLPGHEIRSGVIQIESAGDDTIKEGKVGEVVIRSDPSVSLAVENEKQRQLDMREAIGRGVFFPYAKWQPGTLIHSLVLKKESLDIKAGSQDPTGRVEQELFFAAKRIVELERWGGLLDEKDWRTVGLQYKQLVDGVIAETGEAIRRGDENLFVKLLSKTQSSVLAHRNKIDEAFFLYGGGFEKKFILDEYFDQIEKQLEALNRLPELFLLSYNIYLPQDGTYWVFFNEEGGFGDKMLPEISELRLDGQSISPKELFSEEKTAESKAKEWVFKKGNHLLEITFREEMNLLPADDWQQLTVPLIESSGDLITFHFPQFSDRQELPIAQHEIQEYAPNTFFLLSFDYLTQSELASIAIVQDVDIDSVSGRISPIVTRHLSGSKENKYQHFKTIFKSSADSKEAEIRILAQKARGEGETIEFRNFRLQPLFRPSVMFKTTGLQAAEIEYQVPQITFYKVNPTKYKVAVLRAKEPFLLVFSEGFHRDWNVFIKKSQYTKADEQDKNFQVVASYFNGEIKEGHHQSAFFDPTIFETWGNQSIANDSHYLVNGYANSWLIKPDDADGKENYELIIEYRAQKMFYLGLAVSISAFLVCFGYLGYKAKSAFRSET